MSNSRFLPVVQEKHYRGQGAYVFVVTEETERKYSGIVLRKLNEVCMSSISEIDRVQQIANRHPIISQILKRWATVNLPDAWLSGSILAQARWNDAFGYDPMFGIDDADIVYFDLKNHNSFNEVETSKRISSIFYDLPVRIDTKNQARVHQWYPARFGYKIEPYRSTMDAISTFPTTSAAVGIRCQSGLKIFAPFGLIDLLKPVVRANATQINEEIYEVKARRWRTLWPGLDIRPWSEAIVVKDRSTLKNEEPLPRS